MFPSNHNSVNFVLEEVPIEGMDDSMNKGLNHSRAFTYRVQVQPLDFLLHRGTLPETQVFTLGLFTENSRLA
jgi:hypothetical protein